MTDPLGSVGGSAVDSAIGKVFGVFSVLYRRATFSWRIAVRAEAAAKDSGYRVSRKALRLVTREKVTKRALRRQGPEDVAAVKLLLANVVTVNNAGSRLNPDELYILLRDGYIGASEQVDRDLAIREDIRHDIRLVRETQTGGEGLWLANLSRLSPTLGADIAVLRTELGDPIERLLNSIVNAPSRVALFDSWATVIPAWMPNEGRLLGWLGEFAFDVDSHSAACRFFEIAVSQGAEPIEYWRVRLALANDEASEQERAAQLEDIIDHPLVSSLMRGSWEERISELGSWKTNSEMQASLQSSLMVQFLVSLTRYDEAIKMGRSEFAERAFAGAGVHAVQALLRRSRSQVGAHAQDVAEAYALAVEIRDRRRAWGLSSAAAVVQAIHAAVMLSDIESALKMSRSPVATDEEAAHPDVRRQAAITLSLMGDVEQARAYVDAATPEATLLQIEAREAELLDENERAVELLSRAIDLTEDWNEKARMCFRLAQLGEVHRFADDLREDNPDLVTELELMASLYSGAPGAEERARVQAIERPSLAFALINYFQHANRHRDVVFVAERVAAEWGDADLWLSAARALLMTGDPSLAIDRAGKALEVGGDRWGDRPRALAVQIEAAASTGDWPTALVAAQSLTRLNPRSESARWALIRVVRSSGDIDRAWDVWCAGDPRPVPRNIDEALIWIELFRIHGDEMASLRAFLEVVTEFEEDRQVRNLALGALALAPITLHPGDINLAQLLGRFESQYPDQKHAVWSVSLPTESPSDLLEALARLTGAQNEQLKVLDSNVSRGTFPIGVAARPHGRHFAEWAVLRHKSARFAGALRVEDQFPAVEMALSIGAVIDTTAFLTLSLLGDEMGSRLTGKLPRHVAASQQMLDASASRESFGERPGSDQLLRLGNPDDVNAQRQIASRIVDWFRHTERHSAFPLTTEFALELSDGDANDAWLTAFDLAAKIRLPVWCDDAATRLVAEHAGARSFGTPALVEYLRSNGHLASELADAFDAQLIHQWTVGVPFREGVFAAAAEMDELAPRGIAAYIAWGGGDHAQSKVEFMMRAMGVLHGNPDYVGAWAGVALNYLGDVVESPTAQVDNQAKLVHHLILRPWMNSSLLTFIAKSGRVELADRWGEVFQLGFRRAVSDLRQSYDHPTAAAVCLDLVGGLEPAERQLALEAILSK